MVHQRWGIVGLLALVGLVLRWPNATYQIEYDEVISLLFARLDFGRLVSATAADTMPPLYYTLLHFWLVLGDDMFVARLLSTALGVASIPLLFMLGRRLLNETTGFMGAGLLAISPFHIFYGHYARMYTLLLCLGLIAVLGFVDWLQRGERRGLVVFVIAMGASMYVHNLAILLLLTVDVLFLVTKGRWRTPWLIAMAELFVAHVALAIVLLPWLFYLPGQLEKVARAFWITEPGLGEAVRTAVVYHFHLPLPGTLLPAAGFVALLLVAVTILETRRTWIIANARLRGGMIVLIVLAVAPPVLMFAISQVQPVYVERAILLSSAAYYLLLASALQTLPFRPVAGVLAGLLVVGVGAANDYQSAYNLFPRSPFDAAARYLDSAYRPGDLVLSDNKLSYFPLSYLAPDIAQAYLADPPGSPNDTLARGSQDALGRHPIELPEGLRSYRRVWLVVFEQAERESAALGQPVASEAWFHARYSGGLEERIGDLIIYLYRTET